MLGNKIRYLLLIISIGLLLTVYNEYYIGIIFLTILIIPFLLFAQLCYCYGKIRAELDTAANIAKKGENIPVCIRLNNPTIYPISGVKVYLSYKNYYSSHKFKKTLTFSLDCRTSSTVIFHLQSNYAGNLCVKLEGIRFYDFAKLFSLKKKLKGEVRAAVLPDYYEIIEDESEEKSLQVTDSEFYSPIGKGDDVSEIFNIREYREGDPLQRIHWKLSRKQNQLMIKEFSDPVNCSVLLLVNFNIPDKENVLAIMDAILEVTLSISHTLVLSGINHDVSWYDVESGTCRRVLVKSEEDFFETVDGMLHALPYKEAADLFLAYLAEYPQEEYSSVYFINGHNSCCWIHSLSEVKAARKRVINVRSSDNRPDSMDETSDLQIQFEDEGIELWTLRNRKIISDQN